MKKHLTTRKKTAILFKNAWQALNACPGILFIN